MPKGETVTKKKQRKNVGKNAVSILICLMYLLPLYVLLNMAFKLPTDLGSRLTLPTYLSFVNFKEAFKDDSLIRALGNTVVITLGVVSIEVIFGCMAAFPLSRNRSRFNSIIEAVVLGVMMIPALSILVGVYTEIVSLGGINHLWAVIAIESAFGLPLSIYMYKNFITSIPVALDEAGILDGASSLRLFWSVILPQLKPVTVSIIIMKGVSAWNTYLYPSYILQKPEKYTLVLLIKKYFGSADSQQNLHGAAAVTVLCILPLIVIYLCLQKYFIKGQIDSSVK